MGNPDVDLIREELESGICPICGSQQFNLFYEMMMEVDTKSDASNVDSLTPTKITCQNCNWKHDL